MRERLAEADRADRRAAVAGGGDRPRPGAGAPAGRRGPARRAGPGAGRARADARRAERRSCAAGAPRAADGVARAAASARDSVKALRRAIFDLHPMALEELGLRRGDPRAGAAAGVARGARVARPGGRRRALGDPPHGRLPDRPGGDRQRRAPRRRRRRSRSPRAPRTTGSSIEVSDDGRGFDPGHARARASRDGHLGLAAMSERAALAGGRGDDLVGAGATARPSGCVLPAADAGSGRRARRAPQRGLEGVLVGEAELDHHLTVRGRRARAPGRRRPCRRPRAPRRRRGRAGPAAAARPLGALGAGEVLGRAHAQALGDRRLGDPQAPGAARRPSGSPGRAPR